MTFTIYFLSKFTLYFNKIIIKQRKSLYNGLIPNIIVNIFLDLYWKLIFLLIQMINISNVGTVFFFD